MKVKKFELGPIGVNTYLLLPENTKTAILVDAPHQSYECISDILKESGRTLSALLLTHGHWDHIWEAHNFAKEGVSVYAGKDGSDMIENPETQRAFLFGFDGLEATTITHKISDGQVLDIDGIKIKCSHAPGHCDGSIVYYFEDSKIAFVGDVIFEGSIGRYDLPTGDYSKLENSIREKIYTLEDDTILATGHGGSTTVKNEKANNAYIRA